MAGTGESVGLTAYSGEWGSAHRRSAELELDEAYDVKFGLDGVWRRAFQ